MTPTVLLAGAFGQANPGDDALLAAFAGALPGHRLLVPARGPVPALGNVLPIPASPLAVASALRDVDAVVLGGGTVFKLLEPSTGRPARSLLWQANALASAARLTGKPVAALGVGAGRLDGAGRRLTRRLASRLDLLVLRDEASAELLATAGVPSPIRVGADPVWTLLPGRLRPVAAASEPGAGPVHVAVSHHAGVEPTVLAGALRAAVERGHRVVLEPWQRGPSTADAELATAIAAQLPGRAVEIAGSPGDVTAAVEGYRAAALVVGLRFHALVAAAAAGARFLAVDHEPKLAGIARRTGQRSVPAHAPVGVLRRSLLLALDGPPPPAEAVRIEVARAEAGFDLLRLLLSGGRGMDIDAIDGLELVGGGRSW